MHILHHTSIYLSILQRQGQFTDTRTLTQDFNTDSNTNADSISLNSANCASKRDNQLPSRMKRVKSFSASLGSIKSSIKRTQKITKEVLPDSNDWLNLIDWLTIVVIVVAMIFRVLFVTGAAALHNEIRSVWDGEGNQASKTTNLEHVYNDFYHLDGLIRSCQWMSIALILVGLIQFFRYISFDARLNIVTATLYAAAYDLLPTLFIFCAFLLAYGLMGTLLYGAVLPEWSTISNSMESLFQILLGEVAVYYDMKRVNQRGTQVYFWTFIGLMLYVLLNMILAVIFKVYDEQYTLIHNHLANKEKEKEK